MKKFMGKLKKKMFKFIFYLGMIVGTVGAVAVAGALFFWPLILMAVFWIYVPTIVTFFEFLLSILVTTMFLSFQFAIISKFISLRS